MSVPIEFNAASTVFANGVTTLSFSKANQTANSFWSGPAGSAGPPTFRKIVYADLANLNLTLGQFMAGSSGQLPVATDLLAGSGIILTKADGSITVSASINASNIGTVTSVGLTTSSLLFQIAPASPITNSGTFMLIPTNQSVNTIVAGPATGSSDGAATARYMVEDDMPRLFAGQIYIGSPTTNKTVRRDLVAGTGISIVTTNSSTTLSSTAASTVQTLAKFYASPATSSGLPSFRAIQTTDLPPLGSGQLYIGSAGTAMVSSLSAGAGIEITPGMGTLTIAATGGGGGGATRLSELIDVKVPFSKTVGLETGDSLVYDKERDTWLNYPTPILGVIHAHLVCFPPGKRRKRNELPFCEAVDKQLYRVTFVEIADKYTAYPVTLTVEQAGGWFVGVIYESRTSTSFDFEVLNNAAAAPERLPIVSIIIMNPQKQLF
jgi:hypothetical protein